MSQWKPSLTSALARSLQILLLLGFALSLSAASCGDDNQKKDGVSDKTAAADAPKTDDVKADGEKPAAAAAPGEEIAPDTYPGFNLEVLNAQERSKFVAMARAELCPCPESTQSMHDCLRKEETQCEIVKTAAIYIASGIKEGKTQTVILDEVAKYIDAVNKTHDFKLADTPVKGNPEADVKLVEFADFQCPHCRMVVPIMDEVSKKYGDKIAFYYKHFPLPSHPQAMLAAQASEAAHRQGKFWPMHAMIFENQESLSKAKLRSFAQELGLNMDKFNKDFESSEVATHVTQQRAEGETAQIDGTPSLFINGKRYMGEKSVEAISAEIDKAMAGDGDGAKK